MDELVILKKYGSAGGESILNYNEARQWARLERRTGAGPLQSSACSTSANAEP